MATHRDESRGETRSPGTWQWLCTEMNHEGRQGETEMKHEGRQAQTSCPETRQWPPTETNHERPRGDKRRQGVQEPGSGHPQRRIMKRDKGRQAETRNPGTQQGPPTETPQRNETRKLKWGHPQNIKPANHNPTLKAFKHPSINLEGNRKPGALYERLPWQVLV